MIRRTFWFLVGLVSGIYATIWARRKAEQVSERLTPSAIADQVLGVLKAVVTAAVSGVGFLIETASSRGAEQPPAK